MNFLHEFQKKWNCNKQKNGHISKWEFKQNRKRLKSPVPLAQPFAPVDRSLRNTSAQSIVTQTVNQRGGAVWEMRGTIPGKDGDQAPGCDTGALDPGACPPPSLHSVHAPLPARPHTEPKSMSP